MNLQMPLVVVLAVASLYIGFGGYTADQFAIDYDRHMSQPERNPDDSVIFDGMDITDTETLQLMRRYERIKSIWPWVFWLDGFVVMMLTSASFGCLGGITRVLKCVVFNAKVIAKMNVAAILLLGALLAMVVYALSYFVSPVLITQDSEILSPIAVVVVSLLSGLFGELAYAWIERNAKRIFGSTTREKE